MRMQLIERFFPDKGRKRAAVLLTLSNLFTYLVTAVSGILTAKILLPEEYAVKVLVFSIVNFALALADLGIPFALVKEAGALSAERARQVFLKCVWLNGVSCAIFYLGGFVFFVATGRALFGIDSAFLFGTLVLANIFRQISALSGSYLLVLKKIPRLSLLNLVFGAVYIVSVPVLTLFFGLSGLFIGVLLSYSLDALLKFRETGVGIEFGLGRSGPMGKIEGALLSTGIVYAGVSWLSYVIQNYGNVLLGFFWQRQLVAYYAIAYLPIFPMIVASGSIFSAVMVDFVQSAQRERSRVVKKAIGYSLGISFFLGIVALLGYFILTKIFLQKYLQAFLLLPYLIVPFVLESSISAPLVNFLVTAGEWKRAFALRASQVLVAVSSGFALIGGGGLMGAVQSVWISSVFGAAALSIFSARFFSTEG